MIDKRKRDEGTLGKYDVDCPYDRPRLDSIGVDFATFEKKVKELGYDSAKIEAWVRPLVQKQSAAELAAFNESRSNWKPDDHSQQYFDAMKSSVRPNRKDVTTWFQILYRDERCVA